MKTHPTSDYDTDRITVLTSAEADIPRAYVDSKGVPTFGIGLNLRPHDALVMQALGFDFGGQYLAGTALQQERAYGRQLVQRFRQDYTVGSYDANIAENNPAKVAFDAILLQRQEYFLQLQYDPANFVSQEAYDTFILSLETEFEITSADIRNALVESTLDGYTVPNVDGSQKKIPGYEASLDKWLTDTGVGAKQQELYNHNSKERIALLSLTFNSPASGGVPTILGQQLQNALKNDNRAEAWYEIRYNSNKGGWQEINQGLAYNEKGGAGVAKRRFMEADLFGLYDEGVTTANISDEQAKDIYRMYTNHKREILTYEGTYIAALGLAQSEGSGVIVQGLEGAFAPATSLLTKTYVKDFRISVPIDYRDIQVAAKTGSNLTGNRRMGYDLDETYSDRNDLLIGSEQRDRLEGYGGSDVLHGLGGNDLLAGHEGNDYLIGGTGTDLLQGGEGTDTYIFKSGDGQDIIDDSDGLGSIYIGDVKLTGAGNTTAHIDKGIRSWQAADGYTYTLDAQNTLTITGGTLNDSDKISIKNFDPSKDTLGLHLNTERELGLLPGGISNPFREIGAVVQSYAEEISEGGARLLRAVFNQPACAGDTIVLMLSGGDPNGASICRGDDTLSFAAGPITLTLREGQTEVAFALLNTGDLDSQTAYQITATYQPADPEAQSAEAHYTLTVNGLDEAQESVEGGNVILGDQAPLLDGSGNIQYDAWDNIIPSGPEPGRSDVIHDTSGNDTILAGGGDDIVWRQRGGDDIIDLGDGDDDFYTVAGTGGRVHVRGGAGSDYLGAGAGRDVIEGGEGADGLYGSAEDDEIYGGEKGEAAAFIAQGRSEVGSGLRGEWVDAEAGSDRVFTGAGNDLIAGGDGDDLIVAGGGDDQIWGDWNTWSPTDEWRSWSVSEDVQEDAQGNK
ncbi:MAG: calcium-binding protein, partial [Candidatus Zixiibacteriota bacterium]